MAGSLKRENELSDFLRFISIADVDVDVSSILQLDPPNPDIVCRESGTECGFELTMT